MNARKLLAVGLAALLVSAGVGAAATSSSTGATTAATAEDVDDYAATASYDNGTVTFTVTNNSSGVSGLGVTVDGASVGTTDANGSVAFDVNDSETENFTVVATGDNVTAEFTYALDNGSLTFVDGEFAYVEENETDTNETDLNETEENETEESEGPSFDLPADASDNAKSVLQAITDYFNGDSDAETLGEAVSAVAGNGNAPEDAGKPDDVGPQNDSETGPPEDAGPKDDDRGPPENKGPDADDEADEDDSEQSDTDEADEDDSEQSDTDEADEADEEEDDDEEEEEDDEEEDDDDDEAQGNSGNNGNGNGR
ncbi:hypothetical protein [Halobaculum limi]|uniref:hypothetical protein n=1 Tax=Halobaculum limi TaxID=3031916 RepID=UPI002406BA89|nr:hypothetical protein [Halobaculum sp. YSMS11]